MPQDPTRSLLLIDDEPAQLRLVGAIAMRGGWRVETAANGDEALARIGHGARFDVVLIDMWADDGDAAAAVAAIHAICPTWPILMLTAESSIALATKAMRAGVSDFLIKPIAPDRLAAALDHATGEQARRGELRPLAEKLRQPLGFDEIVGSTPEIRAALAIAAKAARARLPVLIEGEPGVGKDVLGYAIHAASPRGRRPLTIMNCAAIPANLIESELFGHERGAFPGAFDKRIGRIHDAEGGTLLLDAVGAIPADVQVKLLRLIQTGEIQPIGSRLTQHMDVRIIAAADRPLIEDVARGSFREDLYYQLAMVQLTIPPLRHRAGDIAALTRHLLARIARLPGMRGLGITDAAIGLLTAYGWPGNVRQLHDALFRAAIGCDGDALTIADFPQIARETIGAPGERAAAASGGGVTLFEPNGHLRPLDAIEADVIRLAIGHYRGRMSEVARRLGIGRSTLYRKLGELGITDAA